MKPKFQNRACEAASATRGGKAPCRLPARYITETRVYLCRAHFFQKGIAGKKLKEELHEKDEG